MVLALKLQANESARADAILEGVRDVSVANAPDLA